MMYTSTLLLSLASAAFAAPVERRQDPCAQGGPGVCLNNQIGADQDFFFYRNEADGNGFAIPRYTPDFPAVRVPAGQSVFVPLDAAWKGRVQRADAQPSTWVEFQVKAGDGLAWGDISYIQGFDGPATIASMDGAVTCGDASDLANDSP